MLNLIVTHAKSISFPLAFATSGSTGPPRFGDIICFKLRLTLELNSYQSANSFKTGDIPQNSKIIEQWRGVGAKGRLRKDGASEVLD